MLIKSTKPKPIKRRRVTRLPIWRVPERGSIIPRLQPHEELADQIGIGFMANLTPEDE